MGNGYDYGNANAIWPGGPRGRSRYGGYSGIPHGSDGLRPGPPGYDGYNEYDTYYDDQYGGASHPAVQWGLVCGIVLAVAMVAPVVVLEIAYPYYLSHPQLVSQSLAAKPDLGASAAIVRVTLVSVVVAPVALFLAGFLTTRETGTIGSGAVAGALGGGVAFVVYIFGSIFLAVVQNQSVPWDQLPGTSHVVLGLAVGSGFLATSCCGLVLFTLPPALIALAGAALARLIWGPA